MRNVLIELWMSFRVFSWKPFFFIKGREMIYDNSDMNNRNDKCSCKYCFLFASVRCNSKKIIFKFFFVPVLRIVSRNCRFLFAANSKVLLVCLLFFLAHFFRLFKCEDLFHKLIFSIVQSLARAWLFSRVVRGVSERPKLALRTKNCINTQLTVESLSGKRWDLIYVP